MRKTAIVIVCMMLSSFALLGISANVSAVDTHTWDGGGGNALASTGANWDQGDTAPEGGDAVVFSSGSASCTWDLALTMGTFTMSGTYSGTVTQGANFGVASFAIGAGTFTGSTTYLLTDAGSFTRTAGTVTPNVLRISMGTGTFTDNNVDIYDLTVTGAVTLMGYPSVLHNLVINNGAVLTIGASQTPGVKLYSTSTFTNNGIIVMSTTTQFLFCLYSNFVVSPGVFQVLTDGATTATVHITNQWNAGADYTLTAGSDWNIPCCLDTIKNGGTARLVSFDLSTSNYNLTATKITVGASTTILGRGGTISCSGNFDSSAGTFTQATSNLVMTGSSKTLKLATGASVHDLTIGTGASTTLASNAIVAGDLVQTGAFSLSTYTLAVTGSSTFNSNLAFTTAGTYTPTGAIVCAGNWNTDGCTYTEGTVAVNMTGSGKTITLASDQEIYDLTVSGDTALASDIDIGNELTIQPGITLDAGIGLYVIAVKGDSDTPVLGYGLFIGWLYLDGTAELQTIQVGELSAGYLYTQWETHIDIDGALWLNVTPDAEYVNITITSVDVEATYAGPVLTWTATADNDMLFEISPLNADTSYGIMAGGERYLTDTVEANQSLRFTYPGSGSAVDFSLARSDMQQIVDLTYWIVPALAGIFLLIGLMGYMTGQLGEVGSSGKGKRNKR